MSQEKTVYIATSLGNRGDYADVRSILHELGYTLTFDWTASSDPETPRERAGRSTEYMAAIMHANLVVVILPGGRGTHTEFGAALMIRHLAIGGWVKGDVRIVLWAEGGLARYNDPYPCVLHEDPLVELVTGNLAELRTVLERGAP